MKIKQLQETTAGSVASVAMPMGTHKRTEEAANPTQQAAIAIAMKKAGKKPKKLKENNEGYTEINPKSFLDDDFYAFDPETKVLKGTWSHKSVGRRHHEYEAQQKGYAVVSGMKAKHLGLLKKTKVDEGGFDIPEIPRAPQPKPTPNKMDEYMEPDSGAREPSKPIEKPMDSRPYEPKDVDPNSYMFKANLAPDKGATPPKAPIEKPVDDKPYVEPKDKKDPKSYMTKESAIFQGMSEAHISEEEVLLAPGQGVRFKTELMPKRTDHEVEMARNQLRVAAQSAKRIYQNIKDLSEIQGLDGWVQAKITKASDYLDAVNNYIEGKKQMLEIQDEVDEQVDAIDQRLTAQYNTPQMKAQSQAIDQAFASGDEREFQRLGIQSPQQIERDYQTMLGKEKEQDAALMRNPKLTPSARPVQRYNPKGVPVREFDDRSPTSTYVQSRSTLVNRDGDENFSKRIATLATDKHGNQRVRALDTSRDFGDEVTINTNIPKGVTAKIVPQQGDANIEETKRLSTREKFKRSLKRAGYDPDAGADRLLNLIARQAEERKEREKEFARRDAEFYGKRKDIDEGGLNEFAPNGGDDNYDRKIYYVVQEPDEHYSTYALNPNTIDTDELKARFGEKLWVKGPFMNLDDAHEAIWAHIEKNKGVAEDWQKTNRRDKTSGMSRKAVKQYRRENPGSKLQTAVTTKPSKLKKGSKSAKRRKSFCSRMRGMKKSRTSAKTARDPNSNINKALRRWNCESVEEMRNLVMLAEQKIAMLKEEQGLEENLHKWFKEKWVRFGPDGKIRGDCARGDDSEGKPKCLPQSKAQSLGKKGRASAAARKRREDPNPERSGKAINVATKKKSNEDSNQPNPDAKKNLKSAEEIIRALRPDLPPDYEIKVNKDSSKPPVGGKEQLRKDVKDAGKEVYQNDFYKESSDHEMCPECGGAMYSEEMINEKKDACYYKVKSRYKVWPSAYASGALVKCRNKGAKNWGNKSK